jgi:alpha-2-macroglobulin
MRSSFTRSLVARVLPFVLLPALLAGSVAPSAARGSQATSPNVSVRVVSPSPFAAEVTPATTVMVAFDRPVAALTGVGETPEPSPLVSDPPLSGSGRWVTSSIYSWNAVNLRAATTYHLQIMAGLRAIDGTRLQATYSWRFATVRPALLTVAPSDGYQYATPRPTLALGFNQRMDHASTQAAFHLRDAQGNDIPGVFSWSSDTLSFRPIATLSRTATYTAELRSGAQSAEGPLPLLRPVTWTFTVAPYITVTGSKPAGGDSAAQMDNGVEIDFSAPVNEASAIQSVHISPDVPGRYVYFGDDDLSLHLYGMFAPSTAYTVTLRAGMLARAGDRLATTTTIHFVSAPLPPQLFFVTGNAATYDAYRPIILSLEAVNPGPITYTIYRLDRDGYVKDLVSGYDLAQGIPADGTPILSFARTVNAPLNKATPVQVQLLMPGNQPLAPGYYLVRATGSGDAVDYQTLLVTRTGITLKVAQRQMLAWATDLKTGLPIAGLPMQFATSSGGIVVPLRSGTPQYLGGSTVVGAGTTGANGTLLLDVPGIGDTQSLAYGNVLAFGSRAGDAIVASSGWNAGISPYNYGMSFAAYQPKRRLNVYTDRPIYRPGQTVHLRGVVRADDDGQYSVVTGPVYLVLTDAKGQVAARRTVLLDRYGAFHAEITLAGNATLGSYGLSANSGAQNSYSALQVAEYKKPTFAVSISTPRATYTIGQTIPANVAVSYYFGGGVAHAKVHWSVLGYDYIFFSDYFGDYSFGAYDPAMDAFAGPYIPSTSGYTLYQGDAVTDANGIVHLKLPAKLANGRLVQNYTVEASVTDLDNQPVAGRTSVTVYGSAFQIGLQPDQQVIKPLVAQQIHIVTVANDGATPVARQAVRVAIYSRVFHNVITKNRDGTVTQSYVPRDTLVSTANVVTDGQGKAAVRFAAPKGGEYHVVATARDAYGHKTSSTVEIYAGGEKPIDWGFQQQGHIRLVTDKKTYHTGDVAHVLVTTPYANMLALVSIERGHILQYQVKRLAGTGAQLDISVPASYLPDTYVSVVVERGANAAGPAPVWRLGYARIHVDTAERQLRITVQPTKTRVAPGQPLALRIHAVDYHGRPVHAQFGLSIVDAANLALTGDSGTGSDLLGAFYGYRELGVMTSNTLNISPEQLVTKRIIPITQSRTLNSVSDSLASGTARQAQAPSAADHAASKVAAGGAAAPGIQVRSNFQDTAYWNAVIVTDAQGNATLTAPLPDNVTTWKILGQAITTDTLVGSGTGSVMATKDLLLRPIMPRFFSLGDKAMVGATINNTTGTAMTTHLRLLLADGTANRTPTVIGEQTVRLGANGERNVVWPVKITALGTATLQVQAVDLEHAATNDAVQVAVPVQENSTPEQVATAGEAGRATQELVRIPSGIEPNEGSLSVTLEPTLASGMRVGADFLRDYPYDSSIDLASQIAGAAELGRLPDRASVLTPYERRNLRGQIVQRLNRLYLLQHGDGGFGWWIDDIYSSPYITVYVVESLVTARDLGYAVNATVLSNAVSYLLANALSPAATNAGAGYDANLQAEIVYAVTRYGRGSDVATLADQLFDARYLLAHYARAYLMVALASHHAAADNARVQTLLADLTSAARMSAASTHWDESSYDWSALDSDIATTAIVLDALNTVQPHSPLVAGAVRWLMAARKVNAWESTYATATAMRGLVDYVFSSSELNGNYHYTVRLNNAAWGSGTVNASNLAQNRTLTQPLGPTAPAGSNQSIAIGRDVRPGNGALHYVIRLEYFRPVDRINPVAEGVGVTRKYLVADGKSAPLGGTIRVQLRITAPQDLFYLTLEDPLPAGTESVDSSLQTTSQLAQINGTSKIPLGTDDLSWYVTHTDLRDNRTVLFLDFLPAGTYQYTYLIHASTQGVFHTLPTHIQQNYFPEVFGRSNGSYFTVR